MGGLLLLREQPKRPLRASLVGRCRALGSWGSPLSRNGAAGLEQLPFSLDRTGLRPAAPRRPVAPLVPLHGSLLPLARASPAPFAEAHRRRISAAVLSSCCPVTVVSFGGRVGAEGRHRGYASSPTAVFEPRESSNGEKDATGEPPIDGASLTLADTQALLDHWRITCHFNHGLPRESMWQRICRWSDVSGFFSRWNNRKYWGCTAPGVVRLDAPMMTEFERKIYLFREANIHIFLFTIFLILLLPYYYRNARQPLPQVVGYDTPLRSTMGTFSSLPLMYPKRRCPHCRPYDPTCKKACFEKLRAAGHKMLLDDTRLRAWSTPRVKLQPPPLN